MPNISASRTACIGPAPPNATSVKSRGIDAALHRDDADRGGHVGVHDVVDGARRVGDVDAERVGHATCRARRSRSVGRERDATGEARRVEVAEHEVGVGDRRLGAAAPVARRAGFRAGRPGPDAQRAVGVEPRDAAAAGADLGEVDDRDLHGEAGTGAGAAEAALAADLEVV